MLIIEIGRIVIGTILNHNTVIISNPMNRILSIFICFWMITSCQESTSISDKKTETSTAEKAPTPVVPINQSTVYIFEGEIADKYPIQMQLIIKNRSIKGSYYYKKYKELLPIKGALRKDGSIDLSVYDITRTITELFQGKFEENGAIFSGIWTTIGQRGKRHQFKLEAKTLDLDENTLSTITGTYEYTIQGFKNYLMIEIQDEKTAKIQMAVNYGSCTGDVEGVAYFYNNGHINFYGEEDCYLKLLVDGNKITVTEAVCDFYHGLRCNFDGVFKKTSAKANWILES